MFNVANGRGSFPPGGNGPKRGSYSAKFLRSDAGFLANREACILRGSKNNATAMQRKHVVGSGKVVRYNPSEPSLKRARTVTRSPLIVPRSKEKRAIVFPSSVS